MFKYEIDNILILSEIEIELKKLKKIVKVEKTKIPNGLYLGKIKITKINETEAEIESQPYSDIKRLRRITGYLSTLDNFNNAKKHEVRDRIRHNFLKENT